MRLLPALLVCLVAAGCCRGVDPSSVSYGAAPVQAVGPSQRFGVTPEAKSALMIPADAAGCLTNGAAKILVDLSDTARCLLNTLTPPAVVPVVPVQYAPAAAPCVPAAALPAAAPPCAPIFAAPPKAPGCEPCAGGACAVR